MTGETDKATHPTSTRGWLLQYLVNGDDIFGHGRLGWWCQAEILGHLPETPIPPIAWREASSTDVSDKLVGLSEHFAQRKGLPLSADGARKHVIGLVDKLGGGWEALLYFIRWLAWGLNIGGSEAPKAYYGATEEWNEFLYREFQLGRLQAADADVLGAILSERHGSGWNPNAFYPTPMNVCQCMAEMTMHDVDLTDGRDPRAVSVCDSCVGTGRMLLAASNYSVNLWGADIDQTMVDACAINLALFAPWGVYMTPAHRLMLGRPRPSLTGDQRAVEAMDAARQAEGHGPFDSEQVTLDGEEPDGSPLPTNGEVVQVYTFDRHGQGDLFSVGKKGGTT